MKFCTIFAQFLENTYAQLLVIHQLCCVSDADAVLCLNETQICFLLASGHRQPPVLHIQHILMKIFSFKNLFDFLPPIKYKDLHQHEYILLHFGFFYHFTSIKVQHNRYIQGVFILFLTSKTSTNPPLPSFLCSKHP